MGFFQKLFSSHLRQALRAEASGDLDKAAQQYALAEKWPECVRLHEERAKRAGSRAQEIAALRDALYWAKEPELEQRVSVSLGRALLAQSKAEGVKTVRDRERVREACKLLAAGGRFAEAGDALRDIGEVQEATAYYREGGLVHKLELALGAAEEENTRQRAERRAFADYELHMFGGQRALARDCLEEAIEQAEQDADYKRLLRDIDGRWIGRPLARLALGNGTVLTACGLEEISMGRDHLGDWILRSGGLSRRHALLRYRGEEGDFVISDQGSKNGTFLAGMPIDSELPLPPNELLRLGDNVEIQCSEIPSGLSLCIEKGLDRNQHLFAVPPGGEISLRDWIDDSTVLKFVENRPVLCAKECELNERPIADAHIELLVGDKIRIGKTDLQVL